MARVAVESISGGDIGMTEILIVIGFTTCLAVGMKLTEHVKITGWLADFLDWEGNKDDSEDAKRDGGKTI
jgi:hypothetical protein